MRHREALGDLRGDVDAARKRQPPALQKLVERVAYDQLHHKEATYYAPKATTSNGCREIEISASAAGQRHNLNRT
jgi:hypothetical protein